ARHEVRSVLTGLDRLGEHRVGEARPSGAGVELRVGAEQRAAAAGAAVRAVALLVDVLPGERGLCGGVAQDLVLVGVELRAPLLVALHDLLCLLHMTPVEWDPAHVTPRAWARSSPSAAAGTFRPCPCSTCQRPVVAYPQGTESIVPDPRYVFITGGVVS